MSVSAYGKASNLPFHQPVHTPPTRTHARRIINESEGRLVQVKNEADATCYMLKAEAEGEAEAIAAKSVANAAAIQTIANALKGENSAEAVRLQVANRCVTGVSCVMHMRLLIWRYYFAPC